MKILTSLFLLPLLLSFPAHSQNCTGDSVVVAFQHELSGHSNSVYKYTYHLNNGVETYQSKDFSSTGSYVFNYSTDQNFTRTYIERNAQEDTTSFYSYDGNGTGYNYRQKILIDYDPTTHYITSRQIFHGSGTIWNPYSVETYAYNTNNHLINYINLTDTGSGSLVNKTNIIYDYTGSRLNQIVYQIGQAAGWQNSYRYVISYNASNIRDSLAVEYWDTLGSVWADSAKFNYDALNNYYVQIYGAKEYYNAGSGTYLPFDTTCLVLDTFNLPRHYYYTRYGSNDNQEYNYIYINNHQLAAFESTNYGGCFNESTNIYDSNCLITSYNGSSMCFMPHSSYGTSSYDSLFRVIYHYSSSSSGSGDYRYDNYYYYSSPGAFSLNYLSLSLLDNFYCKGDSANTNAIILGGCGPLHFQWTPSIGLSSDTVAEPKVLVSDSITYHITVTDSLGITATATYFSEPAITASITVDTSICSNCAYLHAVLHTANNYSSVQYQWYRNDTAIAGANQQTYTANVIGTYTVIISVTGAKDCSAVSAPFDFLYNKIQENSIDEFTIYPNPGSGLFKVNLNSDNKNSALIRIYDSKGLLVKTQKINAGLSELDLQHLPDGIYKYQIILESIVKEGKLAIII